MYKSLTVVDLVIGIIGSSLVACSPPLRAAQGNDATKQAQEAVQHPEKQDAERVHDAAKKIEQLRESVASGEGLEYKRYITRLAESMDVRLLFGEDIFAPDRKQTASGQKVYGLADAYQQAEVVTYPSAVEGFGNAFLEAIYYRRPLVMSSYEIFETDIQPKGFDVVTFEGFITDLTLERVRTVLSDPELVKLMTDKNYEIARRHYSFTTLRSLLTDLINRSVNRLY